MYLINVYLYLYLYLLLELYFQKKEKAMKRGLNYMWQGVRLMAGLQLVAGRQEPSAPTQHTTSHYISTSSSTTQHYAKCNHVSSQLHTPLRRTGKECNGAWHAHRNILVRARCILVQSSKWCWYPVKEEQLHRKSTGFGRPGLQSPQHQSQSPPNQNYLNCRSPPLLSTLSYSRPSDKFRISTFYIPLQLATFHQNSTRGNELQQTSFTGGQLNCQTQKFTITDRTLTC